MYEWKNHNLNYFRSTFQIIEHFYEYKWQYTKHGLIDNTFLAFKQCINKIRTFKATDFFPIDIYHIDAIKNCE